ncbi:MAG: FRG domain-containing protein [Bacteroidia bacterium]
MRKRSSVRVHPKKIKSLAHFMEVAQQIKKEMCGSGEIFFPWFRGHSDSNYSLLPGLYRQKDKGTIADEHQFRHDFKLKAFPFLSDTYTPPSNDWDWYFIMQHYGLPTRLLDWSEGALVAFYFAIRDAKPGKDACVWVLNPFTLNHEVAKIDDAILTHEYYDLSNYLGKVWSKDKMSLYPIAIQPSINSRRIAAQKGCFTLHGDKRVPLEKIESLKSSLVKIEIDKQKIENIREELIMAGITESLIFPELSGLSRELMDYWK